MKDVFGDADLLQLVDGFDLVVIIKGVLKAKNPANGQVFKIHNVLASEDFVSIKGEAPQVVLLVDASFHRFQKAVAVHIFGKSGPVELFVVLADVEGNGV